MTDRPPGEALIPQCETRKVGDTTYISVPGPVPVIQAARLGPRALLDAYEYDNAANDDHAPLAFAALRAVLDRHASETESVWPDPGETEMGERQVCRECSGWGPYVDSPCPTVQAITAALTCGDTL